MKGIWNHESFTELRCFLGLCNVYRRFINGFREIDAPLYELLKGSPLPKPFPAFGRREERAYRTLIEKVTSPLVLALPWLGLPYSVDTDACEYQIGCALFHTHENGERHPIGFWSQTLTPAENNDSTAENECSTEIFAVQTCLPYLEGRNPRSIPIARRSARYWKSMKFPGG